MKQFTILLLLLLILMVMDGIQTLKKIVFN
jgi:hypothetical protein